MLVVSGGGDGLRCAGFEVSLLFCALQLSLQNKPELCSAMQGNRALPLTECKPHRCHSANS